MKSAIFVTSGPQWLWPCIGSYRILSCITHRPLPTNQILLKSEKNFLWTSGSTNGHWDRHY